MLSARISLHIFIHEEQKIRFIPHTSKGEFSENFLKLPPKTSQSTFIKVKGNNVSLKDDFVRERLIGHLHIVSNTGVSQSTDELPQSSFTTGRRKLSNMGALPL